MASTTSRKASTGWGDGVQDLQEGVDGLREGVGWTGV
jgi:hypothetical protein